MKNHRLGPPQLLAENAIKLKDNSMNIITSQHLMSFLVSKVLNNETCRIALKQTYEPIKESDHMGPANLINKMSIESTH